MTAEGERRGERVSVGGTKAYEAAVELLKVFVRKKKDCLKPVVHDLVCRLRVRKKKKKEGARLVGFYASAWKTEKNKRNNTRR